MKIATHDGTFHADDVFAIATLKLAGVASGVIRTRDQAEMNACDLRVDVGLKNDASAGDYDHHQKGGAGQRPNGIKYASFGLIWLQYGADVSGSAAIAQHVERKLVQVVDAHDNGQNVYQTTIEGLVVSSVDRSIAMFNPTWEEPASETDLRKAFDTAVETAQKLLVREIAMAKSEVDAAKLVKHAIEESHDPRLIVLDRYLPWREVVVAEAPEAQFVVFFRDEGRWTIQTIPEKIGVFKSRRDLPEEWAGKQAQDLAAVTGVPDAIFCHIGRFVAAAGSKEGALKLAELALR
jgi:uncharacterized UPF0160 family protein